MDLIDVQRERGVAVIAPRIKRLDAQVAPAFKQAVVALVEAGDTRIVFDLQQVEFVDSSGLGALVAVLRAIGGRGAMAVCNMHAAVATLFKLTRMDKVFAIVPGRADAIDRVAP